MKLVKEESLENGCEGFSIYFDSLCMGNSADNYFSLLQEYIFVKTNIAVFCFRENEFDDPLDLSNISCFLLTPKSYDYLKGGIEEFFCNFLDLPFITIEQTIFVILTNIPRFFISPSFSSNSIFCNEEHIYYKEKNAVYDPFDIIQAKINDLKGSKKILLERYDSKKHGEFVKIQYRLPQNDGRIDWENKNFLELFLMCKKDNDYLLLFIVGI